MGAEQLDDEGQLIDEWDYIPNETRNELSKAFVLENIRLFLDNGKMEDISSIEFGGLDYGCDFQIEYKNGGADGYNFERNVWEMVHNQIVNG